VSGQVCIGHNGALDDNIHLLDVAKKVSPRNTCSEGLHYIREHLARSQAASLLRTKCHIISYDNDDIPNLCFDWASGAHDDEEAMPRCKL